MNVCSGLNLLLWQVLSEVDGRTRRGQYDLLTNMTHNSEIAHICTHLHDEVLSALLEGRTVSESADRFIQTLAVNDFSKESELLHRAVYNPRQTDEELVERYAAGKSGTDYGFYVPETLAIAYDIFLGAGGDMRAAVYRAVNLGGDSDSTASIVAAMIAWTTPKRTPFAVDTKMEGRKPKALMRTSMKKLTTTAPAPKDWM